MGEQRPTSWSEIPPGRRRFSIAVGCILLGVCALHQVLPEVGGTDTPDAHTESVHEGTPLFPIGSPNVLVAPSPSAENAGQLKAGIPVEVVEAKAEWFLVADRESGRQLGWVLKSDVETADDWGRRVLEALEASEEIRDEDDLAEFQKAIVSAGFMCPIAIIGYREGIAPRGHEVRIQCGATGLPSRRLVYRVIVNAEGFGYVEPW